MSRILVRSDFFDLLGVWRAIDWKENANEGQGRTVEEKKDDAKEVRLHGTPGTFAGYHSSYWLNISQSAAKSC